MKLIFKIFSVLFFVFFIGNTEAQSTTTTTTTTVVTDSLSKTSDKTVSVLVTVDKTIRAKPTDFWNNDFWSLSSGLKALMLILGLGLILFSIKYNYQPLLLVPIGIGMLFSNIPFLINGNTQFNILDETSFFHVFYKGLSYGIYPSLIFIGIGAMTDFSALIANPKLMLLGAVSQLGILAVLIFGHNFGLNLPEAASVGMIGGADGPISIFTSAHLSPGILVPIALSAYIFMALVPVIQPPIMRMLTSQKERVIKMKPQRAVTYNEKILFPVIGLILTGIIAPRALPILGMLFFGNLLKESGSTKRLAFTASNTLLDIVTILLGLTLGAAAQPDILITHKALMIFILGGFAFVIATISGVLFAKVMNLFLSRENKINPLIGNAGVSALPDSARISQMEGLRADPSNHLLVHAMGPNVAGVISSAIIAGILMSCLM